MKIKNLLYYIFTTIIILNINSCAKEKLPNLPININLNEIENNFDKYVEILTSSSNVVFKAREVEIIAENLHIAEDVTIDGSHYLTATNENKLGVQIILDIERKFIFVSSRGDEIEKEIIAFADNNFLEQYIKHKPSYQATHLASLNIPNYNFANQNNCLITSKPIEMSLETQSKIARMDLTKSCGHDHLQTTSSQDHVEEASISNKEDFLFLPSGWHHIWRVKMWKDQSESWADAYNIAAINDIIFSWRTLSTHPLMPITPNPYKPIQIIYGTTTQNIYVFRNSYATLDDFTDYLENQHEISYKTIHAFTTARSFANIGGLAHLGKGSHTFNRRVCVNISTWQAVYRHEVGHALGAGHYWDFLYGFVQTGYGQIMGDNHIPHFGKTATPIIKNTLDTQN